MAIVYFASMMDPVNRIAAASVLLHPMAQRVKYPPAVARKKSAANRITFTMLLVFCDGSLISSVPCIVSETIVLVSPNNAALLVGIREKVRPVRVLMIVLIVTS